MSEARQPTRAQSRKLKSNTDLKASNSNVVQQAKLMDSAGTAWHAVKYGNLELIMKLFPSQCNVYNKGPVGENVFHVAMLLNTPSTLAIAKYLVKLYGSTLVNTPYQERKNEADPPGQYEGETALHIAIVNRDFDMVKFLVQNSADVRVRAYGAFFQEGSQVYYGEFPLSFAACTGQKDIVSYLKRHGARVNADRDTSGNTALHMCVYHEQPDMYDHLVEYCGASEHLRNNRGQTPLLLAASLGKQEIFQHIYNRRRKIVRRAHMDVLSDPLIKTLLETKWRRFAMMGFLMQMSLYTIFVVLQTFLIWVHCDALLWNTSSRQALEIVSLIFACVFFLLEILDIYMWTIGVYNRRKYMKANASFRPPLYPIPGDVADEAAKPKTGFLTRMIKGAIAEGVETNPDADPARLPRSPRLSANYSDEDLGGAAVRSSITVKTGPVPAGSEATSHSRMPEPQAYGKVIGVTRQGAGPVGEGVEKEDTYTASSIGSSGFVAAKHDLPAPMPPLTQSTKVQTPVYTQGSHTVDIVSVGLAGLNTSNMMPSFISSPPVTSMLGGQPRPLKDIPGNNQPYPGNHDSLLGFTLPPTVSNMNEINGGGAPMPEASDDLSKEQGEIKNRLRGGGGGDLPMGSGKNMRGETVRKPSGGKEEKDDLAEDDRQPLHVEGFMGTVHTTVHALRRYYEGQMADPITLVMHAHLLFTFVHFITWASTYGGVDGTGPSSEGTMQFDDIIISLVGLTGWGALLYFMRGTKAMGQMEVMLEYCLVDILKFVVFFFIADIGFALAFYAVLNGTTYTTNPSVVLGEPPFIGSERPFSNIGYAMIQVIRFMYGEADYNAYADTEYHAKKAFATIYFLLYVFLVVLMLSYTLIAMIMHTFNMVHGTAERVWQLRWSSSVLRMERRLPLSIQQRYRLGEVSYDPQLQARVYNHVFEVVDDQKDDSGKLGMQQKALEALLDKVKKGKLK